MVTHGLQGHRVQYWWVRAADTILSYTANLLRYLNILTRGVMHVSSLYVLVAEDQHTWGIGTLVVYIRCAARSLAVKCGKPGYETTRVARALHAVFTRCTRKSGPYFGAHGPIPLVLLGPRIPRKLAIMDRGARTTLAILGCASDLGTNIIRTAQQYPESVHEYKCFQQHR